MDQQILVLFRDERQDGPDLPPEHPDGRKAKASVD